jgi:Gluconate 2-dehydrogenase subunit 3
MLSAGAGFALPGMAAAHPISKHLADGSTLAQADAKTAEKNWTPAFLDSHQNETLTVLAERIIPGSGRAQVNRFIDLLLSVDDQDAQRKFLGSLGAFDAESLKQYSHPYKDLTEDQQNEILTRASTEKPGSDEAKNAEPRVTLRDHFENVKGWVVGAYYSSEIGMKELGWTGQVIFPGFPGCQQAGEPQ